MKCGKSDQSARFSLVCCWCADVYPNWIQMLFVIFSPALLPLYNQKFLTLYAIYFRASNMIKVWCIWWTMMSWTKILGNWWRQRVLTCSWVTMVSVSLLPFESFFTNLQFGHCLMAFNCKEDPHLPLLNILCQGRWNLSAFVTIQCPTKYCKRKPFFSIEINEVFEQFYMLTNRVYSIGWAIGYSWPC